MTLPAFDTSRLWSKIDKGGANFCWTWLGAKDRRGYGHFGVAGRSRRAYRVVYEICIEPPPKGLDLDHLCGNPSCVNPAHLEPVTHAVNVARGGLSASNKARGGAMTHCKRGHAFDETNTARNSSTGRRACRACINAGQRRRWKKV